MARLVRLLRGVWVPNSHANINGIKQALCTVKLERFSSGKSSAGSEMGRGFGQAGNRLGEQALTIAIGKEVVSASFGCGNREYKLVRKQKVVIGRREPELREAISPLRQVQHFLHGGRSKRRESLPVAQLEFGLGWNYHRSP